MAIEEEKRMLTRFRSGLGMTNLDALKQISNEYYGTEHIGLDARFSNDFSDKISMEITLRHCRAPHLRWNSRD
jgi:hypothetical protein